MIYIWKKEIRNYFFSPLGYVFMGIFLLISGVFFALFNLNSGSSDLDTLFGNLVYIFMILVPILTMRLLSEERKSKTDQLLLTSPLSVWSIVVGKFLAAVTVLLFTLICTLPYIVMLKIYSDFYPGLVFSNYLGFILIGCCYIAIGTLISSLTENQLTAAILTIAVILLLQVLESVGPTLTLPHFSWLRTLLTASSLYNRYYLFTVGIISPANIVYYLSFCAILIALTVQITERRKWKED